METSELKVFERTDEDVMMNRKVHLFTDAEGTRHEAPLLTIASADEWMRKAEEVVDLQDPLNESMETMQRASALYQSLRGELARIKRQAAQTADEALAELSLESKALRAEGATPTHGSIPAFVDDDLRAALQNPDTTDEALLLLVRRFAADTERPITQRDADTAHETFKEARKDWQTKRRAYLDKVFETVLAFFPDKFTEEQTEALKVSTTDNQMIHAFTRLRMFSNPLAEENAIAAKFLGAQAEMAGAVQNAAKA